MRRTSLAHRKDLTGTESEIVLRVEGVQNSIVSLLVGLYHISILTEFKEHHKFVARHTPLVLGTNESVNAFILTQNGRRSYQQSHQLILALINGIS